MIICLHWRFKLYHCFKFPVFTFQVTGYLGSENGTMQLMYSGPDTGGDYLYVKSISANLPGFAYPGNIKLQWFTLRYDCTSFLVYTAFYFVTLNNQNGATSWSIIPHASKLFLKLLREVSCTRLLAHMWRDAVSFLTGLLGDLYLFDPSDESWTNLSDALGSKPSPRHGRGFTPAYNKLYVHGGATYTGINSQICTC